MAKMNIDEEIIEIARTGPMAFAVQTEQDRQNFLEFVKSFAMGAIHDSEIQNALFESFN